MLPRALTFTLALVPLLAEPGPPKEDSQAPTLKLQARLTGQSYCREPRSDDLSATLRLQLKVTNIGEEPVILYRKCDQLFEASRSATLADALAGRYEDSFHVSYAPFFYLKLIKGYEAFPPQDYFVILRPDEPYFLNTVVSFRYCTPARVRCPALSGDHYLRARFSTWKESPEVLARARKTWRPFGYLWDGDLTTEPVAFAVADPPVIPDCEEPKASEVVLR